MSENKRMIEDYEVKQAFQLGGMEIVLAENLQKDLPYLVADCTWDNPLNADIYRNGIGTDDFLEATSVFTDRILKQLKELYKERSERNLPLEVLSKDNCLPNSQNTDLNNKLVVIKAESLAPEYRRADYQLMIATGGNGCSPTARGQAVFGNDLYSGKQHRYERYDIQGVADPSRLPAWAKEKLASIEKSEQKSSIHERLEKNKKAVAEQSPRKDGKSNDHEH